MNGEGFQDDLEGQIAGLRLERITISDREREVWIELFADMRRAGVTVEWEREERVPGGTQLLDLVIEGDAGYMTIFQQYIKMQLEAIEEEIARRAKK